MSDWWDATSDFLSDNWANLAQVGMGAYSAYQASQAADTANQLYEVSSDLAKEQAQLAREQWERYKQIYGPLEEQQVAAQQALIDTTLPLQLEWYGAMGQDIDLYNQYRDLERKFFDESMKGISPDELAGRYSADVEKGFGLQRDQLTRNLSRYGINPNSGKFTSAMTDLARDEALAKAGARTKAYRDAQDINLNRLGQAINVRKGLSPALPQYASPSGAGLASNATTGLSSAGSAFTNLAGTAANTASKTYSSAAQTIGSGLSGFQDWLNKR